MLKFKSLNFERSSQSLLSKIGVQEQERALVVWGSITLALLGWCDVTLQNASETFFLKRVGVEYLPLAFLASSLLLILSTTFVGKYVVSNWSARLLSKVILCLAFVTAPVWLMLYLKINSAYIILMLFAKQVKGVALLAFWVALGKMLHGRQAKRLAGPLIAGLTVGTIAGSFVSQPAGLLFGLDGLVAMSIVILLLACVTTLCLERIGMTKLEAELEGIHERQTRKADKKVQSAGRFFKTLCELWRDNLLFRLLFLSLAFSGLLVPMLYFQFSYTADLATKGPGGEEQLLALYAQMRGWMNLAIVVIQVFFASHLFRLIGVPLAVTLSPAIYLLGFIGLSVEMSIIAGVASVSLARIQDKSVFDPGVRILYNLFPENIQGKATALLEGPTYWIGGSLGNLIAVAAVAFGGAAWVGYVALPLAAAWLVVSLYLWQRYPSLLMSSTTRKVKGSEYFIEELFDQGTVDSLVENLRSKDVEVCQAAVMLIKDGPPVLALESLSKAAIDADPEIRLLLLSSMDEILEKNASCEFKGTTADDNVLKLLNKTNLLTEERLAILNVLSRTADDPGKYQEVVEKHCHFEDETVRVAARFLRLRDSKQEKAIDEVLEDAFASSDIRTKKELLKELQLLLSADSKSESRLNMVLKMLEDKDLRALSARVLANIAFVKTNSWNSVSDKLLAYRHDENVDVRIAINNFIGYAGIEDQAGWLVERLGVADDTESESAREALISLGPGVTNALMAEHCFGRRQSKEAAFSLIKELKVQPDTLAELYQRELAALRVAVVNLHAMTREDLKEDVSPFIVRRTADRIEEGLHIALMLLSAIHDEDRIKELADLIRHNQNAGQKAILIEALETFFSASEKSDLIPLLETDNLEALGADLAKRLKIEIPSREKTCRALMEHADELTQHIAHATLPDEFSGNTTRDMSELKRFTAALLKAETLSTIPVFQHMSCRQLIDLAGVVKKEKHEKEVEIVAEGDTGNSMFVIVEGEVEVLKGDTVLGSLASGDCFGEMAIFEKAKRSASIKTVKETSLLRLEGKDLLVLMDELPAMAIQICQYLARRVHDLEGRIENVVTGS